MSKQDYSDILDSFDDNFYASKRKLLHNDPFMAEFLYQCAIELNEAVGTISIKESDGTIYVIYSRKWFNSLTIDEGVEAIKHILSHLIMGHLTHSVFTESDDCKLDIAKDLAVNTCLDKKNLPPGFKVPDDYEEEDSTPESRLPLEEGLSTWEYYSKLPDGENGKGKCPNPGPKGQCGCNTACGGEALGTDGEDGQNQKTGDNHNFMSQTVGDGQLQHQVRHMAHQAQKRSKNGDKSASSYGHGLSKMLEFLLKPSTIPWFVVLRRFVSFASRVKTLRTWKRPSRRFGEERQGTRKKQELNIMTAMDESSSISDHEYELMMSELEGIRLTKMCKITIVKFTAKVEKVFEYTGLDEEAKIRFYGGTLFQPFLDIAEELKPDALIIFTDGQNFEKDIDYTRWNSVLWVMTPSHKKQPYGKSIVLREEDYEEEVMFW